MDIREKLVELFHEHNSHYVVFCDDCFKDTPEEFNSRMYGLADHLIANNVTVQEWIPVSERLPKPLELVLCWWESGDGEREHYGFATFQSHGVWYVSNEGMPNVTHWMPLPTPPKGE